jgi:taurine dioxygenase
MRVEPLPQGFGALVAGFDAQDGREDADVAALREAYDAHHLLVFRDCGLIAPQRQAEIVGWFGPIGANANAQGKPWTLLSNSEPAGSQILPFHNDISFMAHPIEGLSLHPVALPDGDTSTSFVSNAVGWDALPDEARAKIRGTTVEHLYDAPPDMQLDWPRLAHRHPACMVHKRTGREFMFISEHHVSRIDGLEEEESDRLLKLVFDTLYAPERRYEHVWRLGDLLIWDNLALQHARTKVAEASAGERTLQRVAIGTHNFPDQLEAVRRARR